MLKMNAVAEVLVLVLRLCFSSVVLSGKCCRSFGSLQHQTWVGCQRDHRTGDAGDLKVNDQIDA